MLKKTVTYTDYNGTERTEDFYFNLSKAEIVEMEMGITGGLIEMIHKVIAAQDTPNIVKLFKDFILKAYGEKSPDGKRFIKSKELSAAFSQTEAYSEIFMELSTDADAASNFVNGIIETNGEAIKSKLKSDVKANGEEQPHIEMDGEESLDIVPAY